MNSLNLNEFETVFIDAHCHLHLATDDWKKKISTFFELCKASHITFRLVVNGVQPDDWHRVTEITQQYPHLIRASYGIHPWYASQFREKYTIWEDLLTSCLLNNEQAAVGEIGLDSSPRGLKASSSDDQRYIFEQQVKLAIKMQRLISVHCVHAHALLLEILTSCLGHCKRHDPGIVLHSFSGSCDFINKFVHLNCYFSLCASGVVCSKKNLKRIRCIPIDRILVESDAPDQFPSSTFFRQVFCSNSFQPPPPAIHTLFTSVISSKYSALLHNAKSTDFRLTQCPMHIENESGTTILVIHSLSEILGIKDFELVRVLLQINASCFQWTT